MLLFHDVDCCGAEYPGLLALLNERVLQSGSSYRELHFGAPTTWDAVDPSMEREMVQLLASSADKRPHTLRTVFRRKPHERRNLSRCDELCTAPGYHERRFETDSALAHGYQWSLCRNIRVFQRQRT